MIEEKSESENKLEELHTEAMGRLHDSQSAEDEQRELAVEDMRFAFIPGEQWEDSARNNRKDRPRYEINKLAQAINTVCGEQKQNRIEIKIRPTNDKYRDNANIMNGLIREIQSKSCFDNIKDEAFKAAATGGIGGWYVNTEYEEDSFDQNIVIKPIQSAASSIYYDPSASDLLKRDANWMFVKSTMSRDEFRSKYPDSAISNIGDSVGHDASVLYQDRDLVTIADYWVKESYDKRLGLLSDGRVIEINKETQSIIDDLALDGITLVKTRIQKSHKVKMYKMSAGEILEGPYEFAGKYIPIVPVFGFTTSINNQQYYWGLVRHSRDSQRVYNYATSAMIEAAALTPKDPYWITPKMMKGHEKYYESFNRRNSPFMPFNPDEKYPGPPKRTGAPSVQDALISQAQQADLDMQATTGVYALSQGQNQQDQSGRAILALNKQGNKSAQELFSNLQKSVEYTGEIILDLIPKIYDTTRDLIIQENDKSTRNVTVNDVVIDRQTGNEVVINDLSAGKYSVVSSTTPSFETERAEKLNLLIKLAEGNELFSAVGTDLIASNLDFDFAEELTQRVRKLMLKQGTIEPNEQEIQEMQANAPQGPSVEEQIQMELAKLNVEQQKELLRKMAIENELLILDGDKKEADTSEKEASAASKVADIHNKMIDSYKTMSEINENYSDIVKDGNNPNRPYNMDRFSDVDAVAIGVDTGVVDNRGGIPIDVNTPPTDNFNNTTGIDIDDDLLPPNIPRGY